MPLPQIHANTTTLELHRVLAKACPLLNGVLLVGLTLDGTANANFFEHGLGRAFRGVIVVGQSDPTVTITAYSQATFVQADASKAFAVKPSSASAQTFDVWVF